MDEFDDEIIYVAYMPPERKVVYIQVRFGAMKKDGAPIRLFKARLQGRRVLVVEVRQGVPGVKRQLVDSFDDATEDKVIDLILRLDTFLIPALQSSKPNETEDQIPVANCEVASHQSLGSDT